MKIIESKTKKNKKMGDFSAELVFCSVCGENLVQEYDEVRLQMCHIVTKWNICR